MKAGTACGAPERRARLLVASLALAFAAVLAACTSHEEPSSHAEHTTGFAAELLRLAAADQADRAGLTEEALTDPDRIAQLRRADSARTVTVDALVDIHGWPTVANVGSPAVESFFILVRHSPSKRFQDRSLDHLARLARDGEISRPDYAMYVDRLLVGRGQPQRYGTQFRAIGDTLRPAPLENPEGLAALRDAFELPPMPRYLEALQKAYDLPVAWPPEGAAQGPDGG